jgi:hypothetical protein
MDRLRDDMLSCGNCKTTNFWDPADPDATCRTCDTRLAPPYLFRVGRRNLAVSSLTTIRSDHLASGVDEPTTLGRVRQHPQEPERWGLHNATDFAWPVTYPGGHQHVLEPNQTIEVLDGARIQIRSSTVVVRRP